MTQVAAEWARSLLEVREITAHRSRPWAEIWRVETAGGRWWLKVNGGATTYEPRLYAALAPVGAGLLVEGHAHPQQPWLLMADAGTRVDQRRGEVAREVEVEFWCVLLARYAALQRAAEPLALAATGMPDRSPDALLDTYDALLDEPGWLERTRVPELSSADLAAIRAARPALARAAAALADRRPSSVQHDDLHAGNVLVRTGLDRPQDAHVIDWGDASLAHPFGTLLVTLDALAGDWGLPPGAEPLRRVRDAYLGGWASTASRADLLAELDLVLAVGPLLRADVWRRALTTPGAGDALGHGGAVGHWLRRLAGALTNLPH